MTETLAPQPKAKPVLFSLLILLSGIAIGVGATLIVVKQKLPKAPKPHFNSRMLGHLMRELKLTETQKEEVDAIIKEHMTKVDELRRVYHPKISSIFEEMNGEIFETLDDQQKEIWTVKMQEMKDFFERMRKRGPGRGDNRGPRGPGGPDQGFDGPQGDRPPISDPNSPNFRRRRFDRQRPPEGMLPPDEQPPVQPQPESTQPQPTPEQPE